MAKKVVWVDDLSKSIEDDVETVSFALHGLLYEIDLGVSNRKRLQEALEPFVQEARQVGRVGRPMARGRKAAPKAAKPAVDKTQNKAIREWARQQGLSVADRGIIRQEVVDAFEAAHAS